MNAKKSKILIVDDDRESSELYADVFKQAGYEVSVAVDGVEGLDLATKSAPDVIFTGIIMPRMDGFGLIEALKKNITTSNIPVFISSHMGREEDKKKAQELGVKGFIVRGMTSPNEVLARINSALINGEYFVAFDPFLMDAPKLSRDFAINGNFQCMECNEKMAIRLTVDEKDQYLFSAKFVCPRCGSSLS